MEWDGSRRAVLFGLVVLLVLLGTGIGTILPSDGPGDGESNAAVTPKPSATPIPTPTPTPTTDGAGGEGSTPTETGTSTETATQTETGTSTETATQTETGTSTETTTSTDTSAPTSTPPDDPGEWSPLNVTDALPGDSGTASTTLANDGDGTGQLRIASISIVDHENGVTEPESEVDDTPADGELSEHLEIRIAFVGSGGGETYLLGTSGGTGGYVPLADLEGSAPSGEYVLAGGEQVTVRTDWRLPRETGNVIQSDDVTFDVTFELRSPGE